MRNSAITSWGTLLFTVLGCNVTVQCKDAEARALLMTNYGHMQRSHDAADLTYAVGRQQASAAFFIARGGQEPLLASDDGEFLFVFEKEMTIALQTFRQDLYFVHAAVLEYAGNALMLVAESGGGKSITSWALLHHGFRYLSDELGPVDLKTLEVYPYPHALCLKNEPPPAYPLPKRTLYTSRTLYVPTGDLPSGVASTPIPLGTIFFLYYCPEASSPAVRPTSKAEAGARLYAHALNPLAHPEDGLDGAIDIVTGSSCFELLTADLPTTCRLVKTTMKRLSHS
jgi:hypothetical protein